MKTLLIFLAGILLITVGVGLFNNRSQVNKNAGKQTTIPVGKTEITGWFAAWDNGKASEELPNVMKKFTVYSPMMYRVMTDGSLGRHQISNWDEILVDARKDKIPVAPVITDESDEERIHKLVYDEDTQKKFIAAMIAEAQAENYTGWSIDIEKLQGKDRDAFSNFVKNMSQELHKNNLKLYMIAYGRDADETYDPALSHDYKVFGQYADQVQLMTYGYNNEYTDPGGETPLDWYRASLQYTTDTVPREKIVVGLSTHGNVWKEGSKEVEGLTYQEVKERLEEENVEGTYDPAQAAMKATYEKDGTQYTMYYENAQSITAKMKIARDEFGINKFAFWRLSAEDPDLWTALESKDFLGK
jgi:spore germination protein YaaH